VILDSKTNEQGSFEVAFGYRHAYQCLRTAMMNGQLTTIGFTNASMCECTTKRTLAALEAVHGRAKRTTHTAPHHSTRSPHRWAAKLVYQARRKMSRTTKLIERSKNCAKPADSEIRRVPQKLFWTCCRRPRKGQREIERGLTARASVWTVRPLWAGIWRKF
jgi:hypothetical protein